MKESKEFTNDELMSLFNNKIQGLQHFDRSNSGILISDLSYVLDEVNVRLSIAHKRGFKDTLKSLFEELEYDTLEECFIDLNNNYYSYFGEYMYNDYKDFVSESGIV